MATMPRVMMKMTAKLTGIRTVINVVISGSRQPCVHGPGVEVERGERGDDECMFVVMANLQSMEVQDVFGGCVAVGFGCISSAFKEGIQIISTNTSFKSAIYICMDVLYLGTQIKHY